jgi:catechol 1,2-dioxygenase
LLEKVTALGGATPNPRVRKAVDRLLEVLFPLIVELWPTEDEWKALITHLDRTGAEGQFQVTAWLLGLSQLVEDLNSPLRATATANTILGPFHKEGAPQRANGEPFYATLTDNDEYFLLSGRVLDEAGQPIAGVTLDAWNANGLGKYSFWDEDQPEYNLRGKVVTNSQGRYLIRTVFPRPYAIPPFLAPGAMLAALGRQAWRPPHVHFRVDAPGYFPLITQVYFAGYDYLKIDSAVGVKDSLITASQRHDSAEDLAAAGMDRPYHEASFDFRLQRTSGQPTDPR